MEITKEILNTEIKASSIRLPEQLHNEIKAAAAKRGKTKDDMFLEIILEGCKHIKD